MVKREFIERITAAIVKVSEDLEQTTTSIRHKMIEIKRLDNGGTLTIPVLKKAIEFCSTEIESAIKEISNHDHLFTIYRDDMTDADLGKWEDYHDAKVEFTKQHYKYSSFAEEYKYFKPNNSEDIEKQVRRICQRKGCIIDGGFEGDYDTWVGVYARPEDKPTYLDAANGEEVELQEKYMVGGFKQDFSEWFEWTIEDGKVQG